MGNLYLFTLLAYGDSSRARMRLWGQFSLMRAYGDRLWGQFSHCNILPARAPSEVSLLTEKTLPSLALNTSY
jgi:hypothetical protein